MLARAFRHKIPLLMTLVFVGVTGALGLWQLERLDWKTALIARIDRQLAAAPRDLPNRIEDAAGLAWTPVRVQGRYDFAHEIRLFAAGAQGGGVIVLTPLRRTGGTAILVSRGYVAPGREADEMKPAGPVRVTGIAKTPEAPGRFTPANDPAKGAWYHVDLPAMSKAIGYPLAPVFVAETPDPAAPAWPQRLSARLEIPNNHLEYALTWFSFAGLAAGIFLIWLRKQP